MPEGHSIHRLARAFEELFGGQALQASSPQGRFEAGAQTINGMVLDRTQAHGKHLFLGFRAPGKVTLLSRTEHARGVTNDTATASRTTERTTPQAPTHQPTDINHWVRIHLGIYGSWVFDGDETFTSTHSIGAPRRRVGEQERAITNQAGKPQNARPAKSAQKSPKHVQQTSTVRLRLVGEHGLADLTGPMACEVITDEERLAVIDRLGPDPLIPDEDGSQARRFLTRAGSRKTGIGLQLMEQNIIAGVGNIYRAETLFHIGLDPHTPGHFVGEEALQQIWDYLVFIMADGVRTGRIVTAAGEGLSVAETQAVPNAKAYYVYQRTGLPCRRCGVNIREELAAARKLYWCPGCQN